MAHTDGPFYHPRAAILSLGGPAVFHFRRRPQLVRGVFGLGFGLAWDDLSFFWVARPLRHSLYTPQPNPTTNNNPQSGEPNDGRAAVGSLVLQPRSLLIFTGEAYESCLHEILPNEEEVVGMVPAAAAPSSSDGDEEEGEEGDGGRRVQQMVEGAPVLNLATAGGVKVGDVLRRAPVRVSLTFRRVKGKGVKKGGGEELEGE